MEEIEIMTHDYIVKALVDGEIRAYAALTTETVQEAQTRHYCMADSICCNGKNNDGNSYDGRNVER